MYCFCVKFGFWVHSIATLSAQNKYLGTHYRTIFSINFSSWSTQWHGFRPKIPFHVRSIALFLSEFTFLGTVYSTIFCPKLIFRYTLSHYLFLRFRVCVYSMARFLDKNSHSGSSIALFLSEFSVFGTVYSTIFCPKLILRYTL